MFKFCSSNNSSWGYAQISSTNKYLKCCYDWMRCDVCVYIRMRIQAECRTIHRRTSTHPAAHDCVSSAHTDTHTHTRTHTHTHTHAHMHTRTHTTHIFTFTQFQGSDQHFSLGQQLPSNQLGGLGSAVSSPSGVRGEALTAKTFSTIFSTQGGLS